MSEERYAEMMTVVTRLNAVGANLAKDADVHAMTMSQALGSLATRWRWRKGLDKGSPSRLTAFLSWRAPESR